MTGRRFRESARLCRGAVLALLLFVPGCAGPGGLESAQASAVAGRPVARGDFERALLLSGSLEAVRSVSIKAPQAGIFQMSIQFMAEEGAVVQSGDPLLDFDNSSLASTVRELETQILDAETQIVSKRNELASSLKDLEITLAERDFEANWARVEAAVTPDVLSEKEYSDRQLAWATALENLSETQERIDLDRERGQTELDVLIINRDKFKKDLLKREESLERLSIRAPSEGLVVYEKRQGTTLRYQEGDSCWPGQAVVRLPDLSEMQVGFEVNEVDAPLLEVGLQVEVTLDAFPGRRLEGEIIHIPSMAVRLEDDSKIAVFKVAARLSETWAGEMKPGMSARGRVIVDRRADAPLVARDRVHFDGDRYRFVASDGMITDRTLDPVTRNATHYVIDEDQFAELEARAESGKSRIADHRDAERDRAGS